MSVARSSRALAAVVALSLAACSGGGGGGGGGGGLSVSVDRTSLAFAGVNGGGGPQDVHFTLTSGSGTYYASLVQTPARFMWSVTFTGPTTATATLTPYFTGASLGSRVAGDVTFRLCNDSGCSSIAWSKTIPYTITAFTVDTASLALTAAESLDSSQFAISTTPTDTDHQLAATLAQPAPWLSVARDPSSVFQVSATAQAMKAGTYQGQVTVAPVSGGAGKMVPVSFTVTPAIVRPPDATSSVDLSASLTGTIPVAFQAGVTAPAWTAKQNKPWLQLAPTSGTGAGTIQYTIDPAALGSIANWGSDVATVEIDPAGLMTATSMRLTVQKALPEVYMLSPAAIPAGEQATVHIFGRGLSQLSSPSGIALSGASGVSTVLPAASDSEAVVTIAPRTGGLATVSVPNPFSIATRSADLAIDPALWTSVMVTRADNSGHVRCAVYDPLRHAVYAVNTGLKTIDRYRLVSGSWQGPDIVAVPSISEVGMSADRATLYVTSGDYTTQKGTLWAMDPDTLQTTAAGYALPWVNAALIPSISTTSCIQATNDARLWFNSSSPTDVEYFDALALAFAKFSGTNAAASGLYGPGYNASADGSRMVIAGTNSSPAYLYTGATNAIVKPLASGVYSQVAATSRDGGVVVIDDFDVYGVGTAWTLRGSLPITSGTRTAQLSPDGTKVYRLVASSGAVVRVEVFDALTPTTKLGEIPVTYQAASPASGDVPAFLVGPQGDVLLLVGNQGLVVVPVPPSLSGPP